MLTAFINDSTSNLAYFTLSLYFVHLNLQGITHMCLFQHRVEEKTYLSESWNLSETTNPSSVIFSFQLQLFIIVCSIPEKEFKIWVFTAKFPPSAKSPARDECSCLWNKSPNELFFTKQTHNSAKKHGRLSDLTAKSVHRLELLSQSPQNLPYNWYIFLTI